MANYIKDQRETELFVSGSLDKLLPETSVARLIQEGLGRLDFSAFDALYHNDLRGRAGYDPRGLCGAWILASLRGVNSSRRLAELCLSDIEFRWITGDAMPEKSTLADFRRSHKERVAQLGSQVLVVLGQQGLLPGERLGVDGTVVRAASSRQASKKRKGLERQVARVRALLEERLSREDEQKVSMESRALIKRRERLEQALATMDALGLSAPDNRLTTTEVEVKLLKQKDGSFAPGHNVQMATDLDSGAIVRLAAADAGNDAGQLEPQVRAAHATLQEVHGSSHTIAAVAADSAYHDTRQLVALEEQDIACYVPEDRTAHRAAPGVDDAFQANAFTYDEESDTMRCPEGHCLGWRKLNSDHTSSVYQAARNDCATCPSKPQCCPKTKEGRSVSRSLHKEQLDVIAQRVSSDQGKRMKRERSVVCEGVFARLKRLLHWTRCPMWGRQGIEAELTWRQLTHNLMLMTGGWEPMRLKPAAVE